MAIPFGTPFHQAMPPLAAITGHDLNLAFSDECPAGPVVSVTFPDRLDLIFQHDRLVGWYMGPRDTVATGRGVAIGTARADLADTEWIEGSTLGDEFALGAISGLMSQDGTTVAYLWAGTACIYR